MKGNSVIPLVVIDCEVRNYGPVTITGTRVHGVPHPAVNDVRHRQYASRIRGRS